MSRTIWSYDLGSAISSSHDMPANAKFLHAGLDPEGKLCAWMEVDEEFVDLETHTFGVFVTGKPVLDGWSHCATIVLRTSVLHIYHFDTVEPVKVAITELDDLDEE